MAKILYIDDNAHGLTARRVLLEGMGHNVIVARNGRDGLEIFQNEKLDMVIVDYRMPHMNGDVVVREVKRTHPKLPVILLSGFVDTMELEEKVKEADCILKKDSREVEELVSAVNRLLRKSMKKPSASLAAKKAARRQAKS